ncbi:uncharacterized protein [Musca autumnalis]|uniref:uncharacterized protein n=1 Tax=Musca autumnalis TaxID=221902 RepID=UPI003CE9C128
MVSTSHYSYNQLIAFNRDMPLSTSLRLCAFAKFRPRGKFIKFMDVKFNWCDMLSHAVAVPVLGDFLKEMTRKSNYPLSCPLKANFNYSVENYSVTEEMLPIYAANIDFNFTMHYMDDKGKKLSEVCFNGSTEPIPKKRKA